MIMPNESGHFPDIANRLWDWSIDTVNIVDEVRGRSFKDYVSWKIPYPHDQLDDVLTNRASRCFCAERLISKMLQISTLNELAEDHGFARAYCIISEPNMFSSEVGLVFSEKKWKSLIFRDVKTETYIERTDKTDRTLSEAFGLIIPEYLPKMYFIHSIEDQEDEISFRGGLHVIWKDLRPPNVRLSPPVLE